MFIEGSAIGGGLDGMVTRDMVLKKGSYAINAADVAAADGVQIQSGAVLTIQPGTTVGSGSISVLDGSLLATTVTFDSTSILLGSGSDSTRHGTATLKDATFANNSSCLAYGPSYLVMEGGKGACPVELSGTSRARLAGNTLASGIQLNAGTNAEIEGNTLSDGQIQVSGAGTTAFLIRNTITSANRTPLGWIDVSRGATVSATNNTLNWTGFHGTESTFLMWADGNGTKLTAVGNTILNGRAAATQGAWIDWHHNVIRDGGAAITVGCVVCGTPATGTITRNTVQGGWGLELWAGSNSMSIHENCIRGNNPGATLDPYLSDPVNLRYNWWGHISGPYHSTHTTGMGDRIVGDKVLFDPWSQTDANCRETPPPTTELGILGYEFVQSVQDLSNTVPLVAGKKTILRVYPQSHSGAIPDVAWLLTATRSGNKIGALAGTTLVVPTNDLDALRRSRKGGIWIEIPPEWTSGAVNFTFELNWDHKVFEVNYANNNFTKACIFKPMAILRVLYLPIVYHATGSGRPPATPDQNRLPELGGMAESAFPLHKLKHGISNHPYDWYYEMKGSILESLRAKELLDIMALRLVWENAFLPSAEKYDQIFGVFPGRNGDYLTYCRSYPTWALGLGSSSFCEIDDKSFAHEIGHNFGLFHTGTPDSNGAEHSWPPSNDWPYPDSLVHDFGYNSKRDDINSPDMFDLMAYWPGGWISAFNYRKLLTGLKTASEPANGAQPAGGTAVQEYRVVSGSVTTNGAVTFNPAWTISSISEPPGPPAGTHYCLETLSETNTLLQVRCFDLRFKDAESGQAMTVDTFLLFLPYLANATKVQLKKDNMLLGEASASAHAPVVTVTYPNGGESLAGNFTITWTANDQDGTALAFNVLYSANNGATWRPLGLNLTGTNSFAVDSTLLPGSASAKVRVEANDGFHTARDDSDTSFTVGDKPPLVTITQPTDGAKPPSGFRLAGGAYDPEDGELGGTSLVWSSSVAGILGTGPVLDIPILANGVHVITLAATDSRNHTVTRSVTVNVCGACVRLPLVIKQ